MLSIWFRIMHCCFPTPTTDSNTSTVMICVTLHMLSAANHQGNVMEFHIVWRVATLCTSVGSDSDDELHELKNRHPPLSV